MRLQHVARVECEHLAVTVVCRFLYDWLHFSNEVQKILQSVSLGDSDADSGGSGKPQQFYRSIVEVICTILLKSCEFMCEG